MATITTDPIHTCHTLEDVKKTKKGLNIQNPTFNQVKAYIDSIIDSEIDNKRVENADCGISANTMTKSTEKQYYEIDIAAGEPTGF